MSYDPVFAHEERKYIDLNANVHSSAICHKLETTQCLPTGEWINHGLSTPRNTTQQ